MSDEQDDLKAVFGAAPRFDSGFDDRVLREAKRVMRRVRIRRMVLRWGTAGLAAAAAIAIAVWQPWHGANHVRPAAQVTLGDAPKAGQKVNILVAYRLARALRAGDAIGAGWDRTGDRAGDRTGDGKVSQKDVDAWAADAVKIDLGGTQ